MRCRGAGHGAEREERGASRAAPPAASPASSRLLGRPPTLPHNHTHSVWPAGTPAAADVGDLQRFQQLWTPPSAQLVDVQARGGGAGGAAATAGGDHKPRTPPPDLPSILLDSRIVYLGMPVRRRGCCWYSLLLLVLLLRMLPLCPHAGSERSCPTGPTLSRAAAGARCDRADHYAEMLKHPCPRPLTPTPSCTCLLHLSAPAAGARCDGAHHC